MGYRLRRAGVRFAIVDAHPRTGDVWRRRWRSLTLFTPRAYCRLPGSTVPAWVDEYPSGDQIADYLEQYAAEHELPIRRAFEVDLLVQRDGAFEASSSADRVEAQRVVVATGPFDRPRVPACAPKLAAGVWQAHSSAYCQPSDVPSGDVLVVGGGNSAAQLAEDLSATHQVTMVTRGPLQVGPRTILGRSLFWYLDVTGMLRADRDSVLSRYARRYGDTIIGFEVKRLVREGRVAHIPHGVVDCEGGRVVLDDGRRLDVSSVLWCTGFQPGYDWIRIPGALDQQGAPRQERGISDVPGLYWLGQPWQSRLNSALLNGVAEDSRLLAAEVVSGLAASRGPTGS